MEKKKKKTMLNIYFPKQMIWIWSFEHSIEILYYYRVQKLLWKLPHVDRALFCLNFNILFKTAFTVYIVILLQHALYWCYLYKVTFFFFFFPILTGGEKYIWTWGVGSIVCDVFSFFPQKRRAQCDFCLIFTRMGARWLSG